MKATASNGEATRTRRTRRLPHKSQRKLFPRISLVSSSRPSSDREERMERRWQRSHSAQIMGTG